MTISNQIQDWKNQSKEPGDYYDEISGHLIEFQQVTKLDTYIWDDSENYYDASCYQGLIQGISEIVQPELLLTNVSFREEEGKWKFAFSINGTPHELSMNITNTDWLADDFMASMNDIISLHGNRKKLYMVFVAGIGNADQTFNLCFIEDETYQALLNHPAQFAYMN